MNIAVGVGVGVTLVQNLAALGGAEILNSWEAFATGGSQEDSWLNLQTGGTGEATWADLTV